MHHFLGAVNRSSAGDHGGFDIRVSMGVLVILDAHAVIRRPFVDFTCVFASTSVPHATKIRR